MNIKKFLISLAALIMIATSLSGLSKVNADNVTSPQVKKLKGLECLRSVSSKMFLISVITMLRRVN